MINRTGWKVPGARALLVAICALGLAWTVAPALASAARASIASAGTITATWSGQVDWTDVHNPADPFIDLVTAGVSWQYSITVRATPSGGAVVGKPQLKISGGVSETAAPPNLHRHVLRAPQRSGQSVRAGGDRLRGAALESRRLHTGHRKVGGVQCRLQA